MDDNKRDDQTPKDDTKPAAAGEATTPEATADSFKRAASQLLHDRFGIPLTDGGDVDMSKVDMQALQEQAPNLIVNLMDAFTQKLKASLEGSATASASGGGEVIDLEARKQAAAAQPSVSASSILPPELQARLGGKIKDAFNSYVEENVHARTPEGGVDVNVDLDFIREHGKPMISTLLRSVAEALIPKGEVDIPTVLKNAFAPPKAAPAAPATEGQEQAAEAVSDAIDGAAAQGSEGEAKQAGVSVKLNFGNLLRSLFAPKGAAAGAVAGAAAGAVAGATAGAAAAAEGDKPAE
jgi:hypothetical protein